MEHMDEKILDLKNQFKKYEGKDISETVCIGGDEYNFVDMEFFDGKMTMRIPESFIDMPLEFAKIKYISEQRPQIIKMNHDGSINITLSLFEEPIKKEQIRECKDGFKSVIKKLNPSTIFYEDEIEEVDDKYIGYFSYKSFALDDNLYNIMFITDIGLNVLLGTFNCLHKDMEEWKIVAIQMMKSIRDKSIIDG